MNTFHLEILTPERMLFSGECRSLTVPLADGLFGIMAGHTPLTAEIVEGKVAVKADGTEIICAVSRGIICVKKSGVRLFCESALRPDEIDEASERAEAESARAAMRGKQGKKERILAQLTLARAANNLRVKNHKQVN